MSSSRISSALHFSRDALGILAVAATLALSWPGVQIARADAPAAAAMSVDPALVQAQARTVPQPTAAPSSAGPSCANPGVPSTLDDAMVENDARRMLRQIVKRAAAQQQAGAESSEHGIVLNGRGYNYRPTRIP
jgi:hypothetical protein